MSRAYNKTPQSRLNGFEGLSMQCRGAYSKKKPVKAMRYIPKDRKPALRSLNRPSDKRDHRVRRERRWSTAGVYPPGNWFAPPGSNQSSSGGNETAEASGAEGCNGDLASVQAVT